MPRGTYLLTGGVAEHFSCAAGPAGWRYVARRERAGVACGGLDVVLDVRGAPVRVQVTSGGWSLRGGLAGRQLLWRRGEQERTADAVGFTGTSPVWALAAARLVGTGAEPVRLRLVRLGDEALGTLVVEQGWVCTGTTDDEAVPVTGYEVADLATGERAGVQLAGDLLLSSPGAELADLQV